jgi:hypothetical protein
MATKKLIIFSGQSNCGAKRLADFQALGSEYAKYLLPLSNAKILNPFKSSASFLQTVSRIETYQAGVNSAIADATYYSDYIGPEASFLEGFGDDIYMYKAGRGGTSITLLTIETYNKYDFYGNLYRIFTQAKNNGVDLSLAGIWWQQGENDEIDETLANAYAGNLVTLFTDIDNAYTAICNGLGITKNDSYKKILFQTRDSGADYQDVVEGAKIDYCENNANSYYFSTAEDTFGPDGLHWTALSYINQGIRLLNYNF